MSERDQAQGPTIGALEGYASSQRQIVRSVLGDPVGLLGALSFVSIIALVIVGPLISPYDPTEPNYAMILESPSWGHPFGTDSLGRDVLTRVLYGGRFTLLIGFSSILIAAIVGSFFGLIAGSTQRNWLDQTIMRSMDVLLSFPGLILALAMIAVLGREGIDLGFIKLGNIAMVVLIIGVVFTPRFARVARGATLSQVSETYVKKARLEGQPTSLILSKEILPNIVPPLLVLLNYRLGTAIIISASLGFLGIGVQPPTPTWGVMIGNGFEQIVHGRWWIALFPATVLALTILSFNMIGDSTSDALDPDID